MTYAWNFVWILSVRGESRLHDSLVFRLFANSVPIFEYGNIRRHPMEVPVFPKSRSIKVFPPPRRE